MPSIATRKGWAAAKVAGEDRLPRELAAAGHVLHLPAAARSAAEAVSEVRGRGSSPTDWLGLRTSDFFVLESNMATADAMVAGFERDDRGFMVPDKAQNRRAATPRLSTRRLLGVLN